MKNIGNIHKIKFGFAGPCMLSGNTQVQNFVDGDLLGLPTPGALAFGLRQRTWFVRDWMVIVVARFVAGPDAR